MNINKNFWLVLILLILIIPISAKAFWPWQKNKATKETIKIQQELELSANEKLLAQSKYKIWEAGFEKKNIDEVIINKENYFIDVAGLNYLFNSENEKAKNPLLNNFNLNLNSPVLEISADFKRHVKGRLSFSAEIEDVDNKIRLNLSKVKLYGIPIPGLLVSKPINKALDEYFNFMYQDKRYQGFNFIINEEVLQLKFNFQE